MKLKLDENLGGRVAGLLREAGHDVETVFQEGLAGANDDAIYCVCCREQRILVTLDLDFADPVRFDPAACGIVVLRLPARPTLELLLALAQQLAQALRSLPVNGDLWIVEPGRIRIRA
ncbi:MAG: DUF5615 family PIN-like protein [bacterium]